MATIVVYDPACLAAELWVTWPRWCPADIRGIVMMYVDPRAAWGLEFDVRPAAGLIAAAARATSRGLFAWLPGTLMLLRGDEVTSVAVPVDYCSEIVELPSGHIVLSDPSEMPYVLGPDMERADVDVVSDYSVPVWWPRPRRVVNHYGKVTPTRVLYRSPWHVYYQTLDKYDIIVMHSRRSIYRRAGMRNPRIVYANREYVYILSSGALQVCCARTLVTVAQYACSHEIVGTGNLYLEKTTGGEAALLVPRH